MPDGGLDREVRSRGLNRSARVCKNGRRGKDRPPPRYRVGLIAVSDAVSGPQPDRAPP